jgi:hypothetical protein
MYHLFHIDQLLLEYDHLLNNLFQFNIFSFFCLNNLLAGDPYAFALYPPAIKEKKIEF